MLSPERHRARLAMSNLFFSHASSTSPQLQPGSTSKTCPYTTAAQTPPRTHPEDQFQAATGLGTPGSDPEPRESLPLRQQEDLEPSTAEQKGEEAGAVHVSVWGAGAELHREESPRAGAGPGSKAGLTPPIFHTAVREGILL